MVCYAIESADEADSSPAQITYTNYNTPLKKLLTDKGIKNEELHILVDKSDFILSVKKGEAVIKQYPIVLGTNPVDDKRQQGDRCTPEGTFHMISKYPHKSWDKFIWFDYPTADSHKKFNKAKADGTISKDAKIGGELGIHGVPSGCNYWVDDKANWTWGCVSLKIEDVNEIYDFISKKTDIIIQK